MAIPETQLDTWSKQGWMTAFEQRRTTIIKETLESGSTPYGDKDFKVFLQGSYGNDTNIYAESDVDIVIKPGSLFQSDVQGLSEGSEDRFNKSFAEAAYRYGDFTRDVPGWPQEGLRGRCGGGQQGDHGAGRREPAEGRRHRRPEQHRRYRRFNGVYDQDYGEGIVFYTSSGVEIINYRSRIRRT